MEPEESVLQCSQRPAIGLYLEQHEFGPHPFKIYFNTTLIPVSR
jgi:hypothetical protein